MSITFSDLADKFLESSAKRHAPRTTQLYKEYVEHLKAALAEEASGPASAVRTFYVNDYITTHSEWSDSYKNAMVTAFITIFNWAVDNDYLEKNPIKKAFRPAAESRKNYATPLDIEKALSYLGTEDPLHDFITVMWHCFARPQEIRAIEARHVRMADRQIVFPVKESKGKKRERCILIMKPAIPIIEKLLAKYPEGHLFRDSRGNPWQKAAICKRFKRIKQMIGVDMTAYAIRHGIIDASLKEGKNEYDIAGAAGHVDPSMIRRCYSHVHQDKKRLISVFGG